jgi:HlyD family secretion protein
MSTIITKFGRKKLIIAIVGVVVVFGVIYFFWFRKSSGNYQFVSVTRGSITEVVSVTGNTTPIQSLDLSFETGGTVSGVYKKAGDTVNAGDTLVSIDTRDLQTQLAQAQAGVDAAQATLQKLQAGPTPQNLQVSQAALASAEQTLANTYSSIPNATVDSYAKANDAVRNQIGVFYTSPDSNNPQLSFGVNDTQVLNNANAERTQVGQELNTWQTEITTLSSTTASMSTSTLDKVLKNATAHLAVVANMLNTDATAVIDQTGLSSANTVAYKTDVTNAITEINTASNGINSITQSISSEAAAVAQAQAQLNVTIAGSTSNDIAAQQAQVEEAKANAQSIQVKIAKATLSSPINGVVTVQDAKVGQNEPGGKIVTSIISGNNFEVNANIPETDIGKVAVGNTVKMTFDAFPGETFPGKVFYIDPAETIVSGVVDFLVKISFDKPDPRIKSGLTANLTVETQTDQSALILPQFAISQNASGTFVNILKNGVETPIPVVLGIRDQNGNVAVASGVTEGEQVINIGLKTQ